MASASLVVLVASMDLWCLVFAANRCCWKEVAAKCEAGESAVHLHQTIHIIHTAPIILLLVMSGQAGQRAMHLQAQPITAVDTRHNARQSNHLQCIAPIATVFSAELVSFLCVVPRSPVIALGEFWRCINVGEFTASCTTTGMALNECPQGAADVLVTIYECFGCDPS